MDTTREVLSRIYGNAETYDDSRRSADPAGATRMYARASTSTGSHYILDVAGLLDEGESELSQFPTRQAASTGSMNTAVEDNP